MEDSYIKEERITVIPSNQDLTKTSQSVKMARNYKIEVRLSSDEYLEVRKRSAGLPLAVHARNTLLSGDRVDEYNALCSHLKEIKKMLFLMKSS